MHEFQEAHNKIGIAKDELLRAGQERDFARGEIADVRDQRPFGQ